MLTLWRHTRRYRDCALVLLANGQVIGEIVILQAHGDGFGGARVQVGLNLPREIEIVRGDAAHRPSGPSTDWLLQREAAFAAATPDRRDFGAPTTVPFVGVGPYAAPTDAADAADDDSADAAPSDLLAPSIPSVPSASSARHRAPTGAYHPTTAAAAPQLYTFRADRLDRR